MDLSFPFVTDWDEDGRKDILCGEGTNTIQDPGNIRIFLNVGSNEEPSFSRFDYVCAGDSQLFIEVAAPVFQDLDMDSLKDLVVGNVSGCVYFYRNTGLPGTPAFSAQRETLRTINGDFIDAYVDSRVNLVDWDEDGDPDVLIGGQDGYVQLCKNTANIGIDAGHEGPCPNAGLIATPNPCRDHAWLEYSLEKPSCVEIALYSPAGQVRASLHKAVQPAGFHRFRMNVEHPQMHMIGPGVYFAVLRAGAQVRTTKLILLR
jgi:hypothetical protein